MKQYQPDMRAGPADTTISDQMYQHIIYTEPGPDQPAHQCIVYTESQAPCAHNLAHRIMTVHTVAY